MRHPPLSVAYILSRLRVNVDTGKCYWIDPTKHHRPLIGKEAGCKRLSRGKFYHIIKLNRIGYLRSQIIYAVKTGKWPSIDMDHKNCNSLDDRGDNLRLATRLQNAQNRKIGRPGKRLPMGVRSTGRKYQARIRVSKILVHLGTFNSPAKAQQAYKQARFQYFGEFA